MEFSRFNTLRLSGVKTQGDFFFGVGESYNEAGIYIYIYIYMYVFFQLSHVDD